MYWVYAAAPPTTPNRAVDGEGPMPTVPEPALVTIKIFVVVPTVRSAEGVVVPMPTLPLLVAIVTVPVTARVFTVIEPVSSTLNNPPATVKVPADEMVRLATVAEPVVPSTVNLPFDAVRVPVTVA